MRVLIINSVCGFGSTGRICVELAKEYEAQGHEVKIAYGRRPAAKGTERYAVRIGNAFTTALHALQSRLFDNEGLNAKRTTRQFLKWAEEYNPDVLWLHNLHGYYLNYEMLFQWIKSRPHMEVKWTLHDCWAFTGHCTHFSYVQCDKWKTECRHCPQIRQYPAGLWTDRSSRNYARKKQAFCGVPRLTIVVVSHWLEALVQKSFLNEYPIEVVYNTVDAAVFTPTESPVRAEYGLQDKKIVLGVSNVWDERKGLADFMQLSTMLPPSYVIMLVGLSDKQLRGLPQNVVGLKRTDSVQKLVELYSAADVFVNLSREETFGLTTVEAKLCGTTPIVYKGTACEEIVNLYGGIAVSQDLCEVCDAITKVCQ